MVAWPPQTIPNLHPSPPCDCPASYLVRRRRIDLLRLMVTLLAPLGALERPRCFVEAGKVSVAGTAAAGTVHMQLAQYPAADHRH